MKRSRRKFSPEFKQKVVELIRITGRSENQVAKDLGISQTALNRWGRQAQGQIPGGLGMTPQEEIQRLQKEVAHLRKERDILKKATAFFAKELQEISID